MESEKEISLKDLKILVIVQLAIKFITEWEEMISNSNICGSSITKIKSVINNGVSSDKLTDNIL